MSTEPKTKNHNKTIIQVVAAILIAIGPPTCSYMQATAEMRSKNKKTGEDADVGYQALADSVKELQETVKKQHETILTMRGSIAALMQIVARQEPSLRMTAQPAPAPAPHFAPLPKDLPAAVKEYAPD